MSLSSLVLQNYINKCKGWINPDSTDLTPQITHLSSYYSPAGSTSLVSIVGKNFYTYSVVAFGTFRPTPYFINSNNIQFYVPNTIHSGIYPIQIFNGSTQSNSINYTIDNASGFWLLKSNGSISNTNSGMVSIYTLSRGIPVNISTNITGAYNNIYIVPNTSSWFICDCPKNMFVALPSQSQYIGREITFRNITEFTVASIGIAGQTQSYPSNIKLNGTLTNQILPGIVGSWVTLVYDGVNWIVVQSSPF